MAHDDRFGKQSNPSDYGEKDSHLGKITFVLVLIVGIWIFWLFFAHFIAPKLPRRVIVDPTGRPGVGERMTYLNLKPLTGNGKPVNISNLSNRITLLNFWGTWCPPCRKELPHIAELQKRFAGYDDFQVFAVSCPSYQQADDLKSLQEETQSLLDTMKLDLPTYSDSNTSTQKALDQLIGFKGYPTTLLVDGKCVIRAVWDGYRSGMETEMEKHIAILLNERAEQKKASKED